MKKRIAMLAIFMGLIFAFANIGSTSVSASIEDVDFESPTLPVTTQ